MRKALLVLAVLFGLALSVSTAHAWQCGSGGSGYYGGYNDCYPIHHHGYRGHGHRAYFGGYRGYDGYGHPAYYGGHRGYGGYGCW